MNVPSFTRHVGEILNPRKCLWSEENARAETPRCRGVSGNYNQNNDFTAPSGVRYDLVFVPHVDKLDRLARDGRPPWKLTLPDNLLLLAKEEKTLRTGLGIRLPEGARLDFVLGEATEVLSVGTHGRVRSRAAHPYLV